MEQDFEKIEKGLGREQKEEPALAEAAEDKEKPSVDEALEGRKELTEQEKQARKEIEKEVEKVKLSSETKVQAQKHAEEMKKQTAQGKIQHLLDLAQVQGLAYAVEVTRKMDDPYLLDLFHDTLAKKGLFKKFLEK